MVREKIIFLRNVFLRASVTGVLFAFFYWLATLALWHGYAPWPPRLDALAGALLAMYFTENSFVFATAVFVLRLLCAAFRIEKARIAVWPGASTRVRKTNRRVNYSACVSPALCLVLQLTQLPLQTTHRRIDSLADADNT
jgi:hypothetical protein